VWYNGAMTSSSHYDVIVIGLGAMGAASLYQLARVGKRVLGIDQFHPPHIHGSSHGETRITRLAIGEGTAYTPFAIRSHELWREFERETNERMLFPVGGLIIGDGHSPARFHNKSDFIGTTIAAANHYGISHEILSSSELRARFPQFAPGDEAFGYFEPGAGFLKPEVCIKVQIELAKKYGATLRCGERVKELRETAHGGIELSTNLNQYSGEQLVVTAGPWLKGLFPSKFSSLRVTRQILHWFPIKEQQELFVPGRCPVFIWSFGEAEGWIYGFPAIEGREGGVKVASESYGDLVDPDNVPRDVSPTETHSFYERHLSDRMPLLGASSLRSTTCLYTVTPTSDFLLGRLPQMPQCIVVSACSGHGFKHSAAVGETVAELVTKDSSRLSITPFLLL
jgi:sarcosine oxidase